MPSKKRKKGWGNDLILPLSDRADCMWCMTSFTTMFYFHVQFCTCLAFELSIAYCAVKHRLYNQSLCRDWSSTGLFLFDILQTFKSEISSEHDDLQGRYCEQDLILL